MNFEMQHLQTRINKIHREFHPTIENKFCTDERKTRAASYPGNMSLIKKKNNFKPMK